MKTFKAEVKDGKRQNLTPDELSPVHDTKGKGKEQNGEDEDDDGGENELPDRQSCASSVTHAISIIIELIRKNNSDYFEPYLFHTLRNRLIHVQQQQVQQQLSELAAFAEENS